MTTPATFRERAESLGMEKSDRYPDMYLRSGVGIYLHGRNGGTRIRVNWEARSGIQGKTFYTGKRGVDGLIERAFRFAERKLNNGRK